MSRLAYHAAIVMHYYHLKPLHNPAYIRIHLCNLAGNWFESMFYILVNKTP
jgi:hypothetical protein